jgi:hypothetical protein
MHKNWISEIDLMLEGYPAYSQPPQTTGGMQRAQISNVSYPKGFLGAMPDNSRYNTSLANSNTSVRSDEQEETPVMVDCNKILQHINELESDLDHNSNSDRTALMCLKKLSRYINKL